MRYSILLLSSLLLLACSSREPQVAPADIIHKTGLIVSKENVSMDAVESDTRTTTSVHASISSGGHVSIGLGILLSKFLSGDDTKPSPVRYEVEFTDGGQITIYHDSRDFEVDDCVEIRVHPDKDRYPPTMKRNKGGCS
jgi:hypothetical protein